MFNFDQLPAAMDIDEAIPCPDLHKTFGFILLSFGIGLPVVIWSKPHFW
jgi:hypothetical protein